MNRLSLLFVVCALMLTIACNDRALAPVSEGVQAENIYSPPIDLRPKVDILWVIDNSASMCEEQADLRANFDAFINVLDEAQLDFQLAVITTDMVDPTQQGRFQNTPDGTQGPSCEQVVVDISACPTEQGLAPAPLIIHSEDARYRGADGLLDIPKLQRDFGCNATVGTSGDGFEAGLESMKTALSGPLTSGHNEGFIRDDAQLAIFFLTDENDCSGIVERSNGNDCEWDSDTLHSIDSYRDFLLTLKDDPNDVIMGGIIAPDTGVRFTRPTPVQPSCVSSRGSAYAAWRYEELFESFTHATATICQESYRDAFGILPELIEPAKRCLPTAQNEDNQALELVVTRATPIEGQDCQSIEQGGYACTLTADNYSLVDDPQCENGEVVLSFATEPGDQLQVRYVTRLDDEPSAPQMNP